MTSESIAKQNIDSISQGDMPVLETLAQMSVDTLNRSQLDPQTYALVRIAALAAMDAAPASYLINIAAANDTGIPLEKLQGLLVAIAPVVGSARVVSAAGNMLRAMGLAAGVAEEAQQRRAA